MKGTVQVERFGDVVVEAGLEMCTTDVGDVGESLQVKEKEEDLRGDFWMLRKKTWRLLV